MWPAALLLCLPAQAAPPAQAVAQGLRVALRLSGGAEPWAALHFTMEPGWHLYWTTPGDSGLAPEVRWELPEGWSAGPLEHPLPLPLPSEEGVDYAHAGNFTLLARLHQPPGRPATGKVTARLDWLACRESCVRGEATLGATFGDSRTALGPKDLTAALGLLPLKSMTGLKPGPATVRTDGNRWLIEVPLLGPEASRADAFFPEALPDFTVVHREVRVEGGLLRVPVLPAGPASRLHSLRGVLRVGGQGLALELPLPAAPAGARQP